MASVQGLALDDLSCSYESNAEASTMDWNCDFSVGWEWLPTNVTRMQVDKKPVLEQWIGN